MKLRQLINLGFLFLCLSVSKSIAQTDSLTLAQTDISILTCRSGDELYSTFGHTAIRINNIPLDLDLVYNYGLFSFDTPNFYVKFMRGQLPYLLGNTKMQYFLQEYQVEKRSIFEQVLILDNKRKKEIIEFLQFNIQPENRAYAYDFFYDNCATRVVDVYDIYGQPGKEINYLKEVEEKTFRDLLKENLRNLPWSEFGIDIVIGARADLITNRRHQMFLPEYLMDNLANATIEYEGTTSNLAKEPKVILDYEAENENRKTYATPWPLILMLILLIITIVVNRKPTKWSRIFNRILLGVSGIFGLFLLFMWFGTNHGATRDNWNVLWLNPLLLLLFTKLRENTILKMALTGCLVIAGLNCLVTFLPQFFHIAFLPVIASIGIAIWKLHSDARLS
ncbi:MAG: hypothetical protein ACJA1A_003144 [Saprospiraceae bacterium]|jgi:hypothetical protein|tara:strand:- start:133 stop:1311 length:1179 start_codon:yes stop_codon:yes gene_type:complete